MDKNNKNNGPGNNRQGWGIILFTTLLVTFVVMGLYSLMQGSNPEEMSYDKFLKLVDNGKIESVTMSGSQINIVLTDEARKQKQQGKLAEVKESGNSSADSTTDGSSDKTDAEGTKSQSDTAQTNSGDDASDQSTANAAASDEQSSSSDGENGSLIEQLQNQVQGTTSKQKDPDYYTGVVSDDTLVRRLEKAGVEFRYKVPDTASSLITEVVITVILPIVLLVFMFSFLMKKMSKGGGMMGIGKSNAKMYMEKQTGVTFQDVAGSFCLDVVPCT